LSGLLRSLGGMLTVWSFPQLPAARQRCFYELNHNLAAGLVLQTTIW
jgi:hypothetical protein